MDDAPLPPLCCRSRQEDGRTPSGQRYRCHGCRRTFTDRTGTPFAGYRWEQDIIALAVHWYCSYRLSAANVRDLLAERGLDVSARTVLTWVQTFGPLLGEAARRRARRVGTRWWVEIVQTQMTKPPLLPLRSGGD